MQPKEDCPSSYDTFQDACYYFGSHTSYDDALSNCEREGARLVDVDPANTNYVKTQVKAYGGGNDFWIGTYFARNKLVKRKGTTGCPIMRGQQSAQGLFATVDCNPSYRFVCQKYGGRRFGNNRAPGSATDTSGTDFGFDLLPGEEEIPVTPSTTAAPTTASPPATTNPAIPAVISVVVFLLLVVLLRFFCKRKAARKLMKKKLELRLEQEKKTASHVGSTLTGISHTTSVNKQINLPTGGSRAPSSMGRSMIDSVRDSRIRSLKHDEKDSSWDLQSRTGRSRHRESEPEYRRYSRRSLSVERNLHGVHRRTPSPMYRYGRRRHHSRSASRPRSTSGYSGSARSSSADSRMSDSVISTITATTFRRSAREPSRDYDRGYSRSTTPSRFQSDRYTSCDEPKRSRTMYDRYAAAPPPMSAHEMLSRIRGNSGATYRGYDPRYDLERQRASNDHYFPQMTNVLSWSDEDLSHSGSKAGFRQQQKPTQPRFPRQAPIRVNRHIHDYAEEGRHPSAESDHIYESLDEANRRLSKEHESRDSTPSRGSGRSRASMRGRKLPQIPVS